MLLIYIYSDQIEPSCVQDVYPNIREDRDAAADDDHFKYRALARLYALADQWLVEDLKIQVDAWIMGHRLANQQFLWRIVESGPLYAPTSTHMLHMLEAVYEFVNAGDTLRLKATSYAVCFWKGQGPFWERAGALMKQHEPIAFETALICTRMYEILNLSCRKPRTDEPNRSASTDLNPDFENLLSRRMQSDF